eukprot:CCRYP_010643-RA/>CCRYP_010643-RA protein AED:0.40 eAED:0.40 QI:0/0/0/1/1/1/2/0/244
MSASTTKPSSDAAINGVPAITYDSGPAAITSTRATASPPDSYPPTLHQKGSCGQWRHQLRHHETTLPFKGLSTTAAKADTFQDFPHSLMASTTRDLRDPKGHLNQSRKSVRSTKPKPFEEVHSNQLHGRKVKDIYTKVYEVRDTVFTDQTGQFPTRSQAGHKYLMVMVDIDSSGILVEPIKNRTDAELTRAYELLLARRKSGVVPRKHVLDNEVSAAMKELIKNKYHMDYELVPPGCHRAMLQK